MKKAAVVTATRAEYGILRNVIRQIASSDKLELCLLVTGTHLAAEYGMTVQEIEADGFPIAEKTDILLSSDSPASVSKTMGLAMIQFADVLERHKPDVLVALGDRYELLAVCCAAVNARIPIAHISGGETTQGAIDETIRHCITKMSYLHFPACESYRRRIIQLGEAPERVFNFGDVGVEAIRRMKKMTKEELEASLNFSLDRPYLCVTFHPATLSEEDAGVQMRELLEAVDAYPEMKFIFTKANADAGGRTINAMIDGYVKEHANCIAFFSLGIRRYVSLVQYANGVLGNSSSGIVEAPALGVPTVNIGNRQKGRLQAASILNCEPDRRQIADCIARSQTEAFLQMAKHVETPYGGTDTSVHIVETLEEYLYRDKICLEKKFFDLDFTC